LGAAAPAPPYNEARNAHTKAAIKIEARLSSAAHAPKNSAAERAGERPGLARDHDRDRDQPAGEQREDAGREVAAGRRSSRPAPRRRSGERSSILATAAIAAANAHSAADEPGRIAPRPEAIRGRRRLAARRVALSRASSPL
jgi:hypothetical protein